MVTRSEAQARVAVSAVFLTNGALFATLLPRLPDIKDDLGLSNAFYGVAVAAFSIGALVGGPFAGALSRRFRSSRMAVAGTVVLAVMFLAAGIAPSGVGFAAAMFAAGAADSITDVAQNAHALRVQRAYGRSIINSAHAVWSVGAVSGGLIGAAALALGLHRGVHLGITGVVFCAVALVAYRFLLPGDDHADAPATAAGPAARAGRRTYLLLAGLVAIAIAGAVVEDAGSSWASLYLRDELAAPPSLAAFGYVALVGGQLAGRLSGDRLVDRFGQRTVARAGALIGAAGMGGALALAEVPATVIGFAAAGFGSATLIPAAMRDADELPGLRPNAGLTAVSWLLRVGFALSPVAVGQLADAASLRTGLLIAPAAMIGVLLLAGALSRRPAHGRDADRQVHR
ncbi:MFS transporter [Mycobacterium sp. MYCO198283]|uniref:MFS transporter n=1 Tax=Mycobacterium sp. MYCO198283 TaxID=2883505 RepID=UPI001E5887BD|nr:MFS transporter [Mycobacterium sp. MYCO198283]MCG5433171.1 MFS transporter [Mycobacterium sp. MYCO198283]